MALVIKNPRITEKTAAMGHINKYVFDVEETAVSAEIGKEVEKIYKVKVKSINIINTPGKKNRYGRNIFSSGKNKKAVVTLKEGHKIDIMPQ